MYLDLRLEPRELAILERGGFLSFCFNGVKVTITKNDILEERSEDQDDKRR